MTATVVIVGRPNVGKSTLFNRLVGRRLALVDDAPGVTRDRREGLAQLGDLRFRAVDTAGLEEAFDDSLAGRMRQQTVRALDAAGVVLLVIDARAGVTPLDAHFAAWLRRDGRPVIVVANKCEGGAAAAGTAECYRLGFGGPVPVSAEHGDGMSLLYDALRPRLDGAPGGDAQAGAGTVRGEPADAGDPVRLAVVGRPNVGKSTLVNTLLGDRRQLTGPEAGITRDAIAVSVERDGRAITLVDTAGLRRRARVSQKLEKLAAADALRAIRFAEVVVLVVDAVAGADRQDLGIASHAADEGRALVIAANKWDAVDDREAAMAAIRGRLRRSLPQVRGVTVVPLSALTGRGCDRLLPALLEARAVWNRRIATAPLNVWLAGATAHHPPPVGARGRRVRLRYVTQAKARPPTFVLFASRPGDLPESYLRYLENGLRTAFSLPGTPIRIALRKGGNPYA